MVKRSPIPFLLGHIVIVANVRRLDHFEDVAQDLLWLALRRNPHGQWLQFLRFVLLNALFHANQLEKTPLL